MYEARRQRSSWARIKLSIVRKLLVSVRRQFLAHYFAKLRLTCPYIIRFWINKVLFISAILLSKYRSFSFSTAFYQALHRRLNLNQFWYWGFTSAQMCFFLFICYPLVTSAFLILHHQSIMSSIYFFNSLNFLTFTMIDCKMFNVLKALFYMYKKNISLSRFLFWYFLLVFWFI